MSKDPKSQAAEALAAINRNDVTGARIILEQMTGHKSENAATGAQPPRRGGESDGAQARAREEDKK